MGKFDVGIRLKVKNLSVNVGSTILFGFFFTFGSILWYYQRTSIEFTPEVYLTWRMEQDSEYQFLSDSFSCTKHDLSVIDKPFDPVLVVGRDIYLLVFIFLYNKSNNYFILVWFNQNMMSSLGSIVRGLGIIWCKQ